MYGIPGFEVDGLPVVERIPLTGADALRVAATMFGLDATSAERLETERDDSFDIRTADERFVLKVAHPADSVDQLDFQTRALEFARRADVTLPLQRILPATDGRLAPILPEHDSRIARLFGWLSGDLLLDVRPENDEQLRALGTALGRLTNALDGFEHPASTRPFAWDLAQFSGLETLIERYRTDELAEVLARFRASVSPVLDRLPRQVIHNDFNRGNVLVNRAAPGFVTGILDFGDVIKTIRVADVAIGLSSQLAPLDRRWHDAQPFLEAYELIVPLDALERQVLPTLVMCRLVQRIVINDWLAETGPHDDGDDAYRKRVLDTLRPLLEED